MNDTNRTRVTNCRPGRMRAASLISIVLSAGAACIGRTPIDQTSNTTDASPRDVAADLDASTRASGDGSGVIDPQPDIRIFVDREGPIIGPDGSTSWPRSDSAVETPDADTWDAGAGCPVVAPNEGEPCFVDTGCLYPLDCCGIVAGSIQAYCRLGTWSIEFRSNLELCAPCEPFPLPGEACSLEAACRSGPPPVCVKPSCYGKAVVARCSGDRWTVTNGCSK